MNNFAPQPLSRIGFIDMDAFFVSVERLLDPSLIGKPVVVGGPSEARGVVAAASYEARKFGVHSAMPMKAALRLAPQLIRVQPSRGEYSKMSAQVGEILRRHAPVVRKASIDEFYMDMTGCERLYDGRLLFALERMREEIAALGLPCSASLASGCVTAKMAVGIVKPNGIVEIPPGEERAFLAGIPIEKIPGCGPRFQAELKRAGILTCRDLQNAGETFLKKRFGRAGVDLHGKACGNPSVLSAESAPAKSYSRETTFPVDTNDREAIYAQTSRFVEDVVHTLRREGKTARTATVKLRYSDFSTHTYATSLESCDNEGEWWGVARDLLDRHLREGEPVRLVGFRLSNLGTTQRQPSLFDPPAGPTERLGEAVDRLRDRFGIDSIVRGSSIGSRRR